MIFLLISSTMQIDEFLGFFQTYFKLNGPQVRKLATVGAKVITTKRFQIVEATFKIKEEMGFEPDEVREILLAQPSIWLQR